VITEIKSASFPDGILDPAHPLADLRMTRSGRAETFEEATLSVRGTEGEPEVHILRRGRDGASVGVTVRLAAELDAVDVRYRATNLPRPDGGVSGALRTTLATKLESFVLYHDHPYGVGEIRAEGVYLRKYPTGDWMTSPQVFEEVKNPFTSLSLLDMTTHEGGLLYLHDGSQALLRDGRKVHNLLSLYDPWDEDYFVNELEVRTRFVPHGPISHARRWRLAQEFERPALLAQAQESGGDLPMTFGAVYCNAPGAAIMAFYRETEEAGQKLERYAGATLGYPYVLRLVEFDGREDQARVRVPGEVAAAFRTNLLGEVLAPLSAEAGASSGWSEIALELRPYEITTLYLDLVMGRKVARDLDAHRGVWATVHRVEGPS
jgi:alpha-mannosidase